MKEDMYKSELLKHFGGRLGQSHRGILLCLQRTLGIGCVVVGVALPGDSRVDRCSVFHIIEIIPVDAMKPWMQHHLLCAYVVWR